jgi:hypothetical protein
MPARDCSEIQLWGVISGRPKASRNMGLSVMVSAGALNVTIFISLSRLPSCEGASSSSCEETCALRPCETLPLVGRYVSTQTPVAHLMKFLCLFPIEKSLRLTIPSQPQP